MELDTFEWLLTDAGQGLLQLIGEESSLGAMQRLRSTYSPEQVAAAASTAQLRDKARDKFGTAAQHMYFTREALEQSTRLPAAAGPVAHRAGRG